MGMMSYIIYKGVYETIRDYEFNMSEDDSQNDDYLRAIEDVRAQLMSRYREAE